MPIVYASSVIVRTDVQLILERRNLNSEERHSARFERRKAAREAKKQQILEPYNDFDKVFSYKHLNHSYRETIQGVAWKASTQKYIMSYLLNNYKTYKILQNGLYESDRFFEFDLMERGKKRHIRSVTINERVVQRCLCDYCLVPALSRSFIYDNAASLKDKGYTFSKNRASKHLQSYYRHNNFSNEGWVLAFDFSSYFDNIEHEMIKNKVRQAIHDEKLLAQTFHFVDVFGERGLGLGSQVSQILALTAANRLDHYIKEILRIRYYGRYMDDGYLIHNNKQYLQYCLAQIREKCKELGIIINEKKTKIVKLKQGFVFLKCHFYLTPTGRVVKHIYHRSVVKMRRKLKTFAAWIEAREMTQKQMQEAYASWKAYARQFDAWHTRCAMQKLYNDLFLPRKEMTTCQQTQ